MGKIDKGGKSDPATGGGHGFGSVPPSGEGMLHRHRGIREFYLSTGYRVIPLLDSKPENLQLIINSLSWNEETIRAHPALSNEHIQSVRENAIDSLAELAEAGHDLKEAVLPLVRLLRSAFDSDDGEFTKVYAARSLGFILKFAKKADPLYVQAIEELGAVLIYDDPRFDMGHVVRSAASIALGRDACSNQFFNEQGIKELVKYLSHEKSETRSAAATGLSQIEDGVSASHLESLTNALYDDYSWTVSCIALTLEHTARAGISISSSFEALGGAIDKALADTNRKNVYFNVNAIRHALGALDAALSNNENISSQLPILRKGLAYSLDEAVPTSMAMLLVEAGTIEDKAICTPILLRCLSSRYEGIRIAAAHSLLFSEDKHVRMVALPLVIATIQSSEDLFNIARSVKAILEFAKSGGDISSAKDVLQGCLLKLDEIGPASFQQAVALAIMRMEHKLEEVRSHVRECIELCEQYIRHPAS
ncbi:HEAT repeat domain-containing protein [Candidatus Micrarchaeota archaeon]|nr:HEAT repeat domain-containing protein [Candidatus Micrarchaeota archaeon]